MIEIVEKPLLPLPEKLILFSKVFTVVYNELQYDPNDTKTDVTFGRTDFVKNEIHIFTYTTESKINIWHTILHEIFHVIKENLLITFLEKNEEQIIDNFALAITHFLIENDLGIIKS